MAGRNIPGEFDRIYRIHKMNNEGSSKLTEKETAGRLALMVIKGEVQ